MMRRQDVPRAAVRIVTDVFRETTSVRARGASTGSCADLPPAPGRSSDRMDCIVTRASPIFTLTISNRIWQAVWAFVVLTRRLFHDRIKASFSIRHLKPPSKFQGIGTNCTRKPQLAMTALAGADIDDRGL
jgi:hypothetical protein